MLIVTLNFLGYLGLLLSILIISICFFHVFRYRQSPRKTIYKFLVKLKTYAKILLCALLIICFVSSMITNFLQTIYPYLDIDHDIRLMPEGYYCYYVKYKGEWCQAKIKIVDGLLSKNYYLCKVRVWAGDIDNFYPEKSELTINGHDDIVGYNASDGTMCRLVNEEVESTWATKETKPKTPLWLRLIEFVVTFSIYFITLLWFCFAWHKTKSSHISMAKKKKQERAIINECTRLINLYEKNSTCFVTSQNDLLKTIRKQHKAIGQFFQNDNLSITSFSNSLLKDCAFELLASGKYHINRGILSPLNCANNLKLVYEKSVDYKLSNNEISLREKDNLIDILNRCIDSI